MFKSYTTNSKTRATGIFQALTRQTAMYLFVPVLVLSACGEKQPDPIDEEAPVVTAEASYSVLSDSDIEYAQGLVHDNTIRLTKQKLRTFSILIDMWVY